MNAQRITAHLAAAGGAAWVAKIGVIAATDGRVTDTGAAAALYLLGVALLAAGAATVTLRLARGTATTVVAAVAGPPLFFASFAVLDAVGKAAAGDAGPAWLADEAGILLTGAAWLAVGLALARRRTPQAAVA